MRKILTSILLMALVLASPQYSDGNDEDDIHVLMNNFFFNISNGFKGGTLAFLADPMLSANKTQINNNPSYPGFLRKIYANSRMVVKHIATIDDNTKAVDVEIFFKNETNSKKNKYMVIRDGGMWKISDEVTD